MRHYEVVAVIHPDQQGRVAAMIDLYKKIVSDGGGVLHRLEDWGRRPLAYPIQNQHKAQYVLMNIECENDTLDKLREIFRFSDFILRSLIIRREQAVTEPSVVMAEKQKKQSEGDGGESDAYRAKRSTKTESFATDSVAATNSADVATEATTSKKAAKGASKSDKSDKTAAKSKKAEDATASDSKPAKEVKAEDSAATDASQENQASQETQAEVKAEDSATDKTAAPASDDSQSKETDK